MDGKTSVDPARNKSLKLLHASHVEYDNLPTYLLNALENLQDSGISFMVELSDKNN